MRPEFGCQWFRGYHTGNYARDDYTYYIPFAVVLSRWTQVAALVIKQSVCMHGQSSEDSVWGLLMPCRSSLTCALSAYGVCTHESLLAVIRQSR